MKRTVGVVVPAYNAALTIDETLRSIRAQTYGNLEILIVDDGSTDATLEIACAHAACDPRIRIIKQSNAGVAAARNRGVAESTAEFIAPIDADDLWHPTKIQRQMEALESGGPRVGLVYCWYAMIDERSRVRSSHHSAAEEGDVLPSMCLRNLVGNGSSALMQKRAIVEAGGYDATLRARNAQGCEDYKLYFQIAEKYQFALVRDHLTGYRRTRANMSSDVLQMLRSRDIIMTEFLARYRHFGDRLAAGRNEFLKWLLVRAVRSTQHREVLKIARIMFAYDLGFALKTFALIPVTLVRGTIAPRLNYLLGRTRSRSVSTMRPFPIGSPVVASDKSRGSKTAKKGAASPGNLQTAAE
jgi:glycosyltransferase involved in cell wall biosynthesis